MKIELHELTIREIADKYGLSIKLQITEQVFPPQKGLLKGYNLCSIYSEFYL